MGCQDLAEKEMDIKAGNDKITKIRLTSTYMYHSHATHVHRWEMGVLVEMILAVASYRYRYVASCAVPAN